MVSVVSKMACVLLGSVVVLRSSSSTTLAFVPTTTPLTRTTTTATTNNNNKINNKHHRLSPLQVAIDTSDIKNGLTVEIDGDPFKVINFSVMKQARGAAKMTIKFKNLIKGTTIENTYRSGEKFETAMIERKDAQFTYQEGNSFFFMDSETFEEMAVPDTVVGDRENWMTEGSEVTLIQFKDKIIEVKTPSPAIYEVVETEPNVKGNTAQGYTKPAVLECGATISVPGFVEQGTKIKVDTEKGEYLERVQ